MVAKWDLEQRKCLSYAKIKYQAIVIANSRDDKVLCVGCKNGIMVVINEQDMQVTQEVRVSRKGIQEIKYSPNNNLIAVGCHDSTIYLYSSNFKLKGKLTAHHSTVTHLDFSVCGNFIQSNCTSYELLYFDSTSNK